MSFLVDIRPDMQAPEYKMTLCKLNREQIMTIKNVTEFNYQGNFANIDELSFKIPLYRIENSGEKIENERYSAIKGDMLIFLESPHPDYSGETRNKYFYVHYAKEMVSESGEIFKEVQAYSLEYELSQKRISGYNEVSRYLYWSPLLGEENQFDDTGMHWGFMNYIEKLCGWTVGHVTEELLEKRRALSFTNQNLLQAFQEVQKTFGCIFLFNTISKKIDIYEIGKFESDNGLFISDKNFLKTLDKSIKSDEIKTRLFLYGRDNISIQGINITGQPYIENYSYYMTREFMSQALIDALKAREILIDSKKGLFEGYLKALNEHNIALNDLHAEMLTLEGDLKIAQIALDLVIADIYPTPEAQKAAVDLANGAEAAVMTLITNKQVEIDAVKGLIEAVHMDMEVLRLSITQIPEMTQELLNELDPFIREEIFTDGNYTLDNLEELQTEGEKILSRISQPSIQFNTSVVDFLSVAECHHSWPKFALGSKVRLSHEALNFDFSVRMVGYSHSLDTNELTLKFSNTGTIDDASLYLRDILEGLKTSSANVDFSRYKWDKGENADFTITQYVNQNFDLTRQSLDKAKNQRPMIDDRGYWGYKIENEIVDPMQMRMTNEVIAMTDDAWDTISVAISPKFGINANLLSGKVGNLATLNANQVFVGDGVTNILDYMDTELSSSIDDLETILGNALSDAQLTNIEANTIELSLDTITSESVDLIAKADDLPITIEKQDFIDALSILTDHLNDNWINQPEYPLPITSTQREVITGMFGDLANTKSILISKVSEETIKKNAVLVDEPYNFVTINKTLGLQVKDNAGRERVRLGNYTTGKYGLLIKDSTGVKTILDEDGILQSWQEGRTDNVQSGYPLKLSLYVPNNTRIINKALLRFRLEAFRAYSTSVGTSATFTPTSYGGGDGTWTSASRSSSSETSSSGGSYSSTTGDYSMSSGSTQTEDDRYNTGKHNHGITSGQKLAVFNGAGNAPIYSAEWVPSGAHNHGTHSHGFSGKSHEHSFTIPSHDHKVTIGSHSHQIEIPGHTHPIVYGIYQSTTAYGVRIVINGIDRTTALGGGSGFYTGQNNLEIGSFLTVGTWNTIDLSSTQLGRIDATVFIQALMNTL